MKPSFKFQYMLSAITAALILGVTPVPEAAAAFESRPSLVISEETMPEIIYNRGSADQLGAPQPITQQPMGQAQRHQQQQPRSSSETQHRPSYQPAQVSLDKPFDLIRSHRPTPVTKKVESLAREITQLKESIERRGNQLESMNNETDKISRDYFALVAGMNVRLQSGTTPGNPDLVESWDAAQRALNALSETSSDLSALSNALSDDASRATYLLDEIRSTYRLSGARDEDHANLNTLEDETSHIINRLDRVVNQVSDEINRRTSYLRSERLNMQTLSLAIANGDLYGENIRNRIFKRAEMSLQDDVAPASYRGAPSRMDSGDYAPAPRVTSSTSGRRPLVIIRFDRADLQYENALYRAVSDALDQRPDLRFDLVAVNPAGGNSARQALASNSARRNGEAVLRSLNQMGVPMERVSLNTASNPDVNYNEVHLYVR